MNLPTNSNDSIISNKETESLDSDIISKHNPEDERKEKENPDSEELHFTVDIIEDVSKRLLYQMNISLDEYHKRAFDNRRIKIGNSETDEIVIKHSSLSATSASIVLRNGSLFINPIKGNLAFSRKNGPCLLDETLIEDKEKVYLSSDVYLQYRTFELKCFTCGLIKRLYYLNNTVNTREKSELKELFESIENTDWLKICLCSLEKIISSYEKSVTKESFDFKFKSEFIQLSTENIQNSLSDEKDLIHDKQRLISKINNEFTLLVYKETPNLQKLLEFIRNEKEEFFSLYLIRKNGVITRLYEEASNLRDELLLNFAFLAQNQNGNKKVQSFRKNSNSVSSPSDKSIRNRLFPDQAKAKLENEFKTPFDDSILPQGKYLSNESLIFEIKNRGNNADAYDNSLIFQRNIKQSSDDTIINPFQLKAQRVHHPHYHEYVNNLIKPNGEQLTNKIKKNSVLDETIINLKPQCLSDFENSIIFNGISDNSFLNKNQVSGNKSIASIYNQVNKAKYHKEYKTELDSKLSIITENDALDNSCDSFGVDRNFIQLLGIKKHLIAKHDLSNILQSYFTCKAVNINESNRSEDEYYIKMFYDIDKLGKYFKTIPSIISLEIKGNEIKLCKGYNLRVPILRTFSKQSN